MNTQDRKAWSEKTAKLNENAELRLGLTVKDLYGNSGVVVRIVKPEEEEKDSGSVSVWQQDKIGYGGDNCEHYHFSNWKNLLRVQDEGFYPEVKKPKI